MPAKSGEIGVLPLVVSIWSDAGQFGQPNPLEDGNWSGQLSENEYETSREGLNQMETPPYAVNWGVSGTFQPASIQSAFQVWNKLQVDQTFRIELNVNMPPSSAAVTLQSSFAGSFLKSQGLGDAKFTVLESQPLFAGLIDGDRAWSSTTPQEPVTFIAGPYQMVSVAWFGAARRPGSSLPIQAKLGVELNFRLGPGDLALFEAGFIAAVPEPQAKLLLGWGAGLMLLGLRVARVRRTVHLNVRQSALNRRRRNDLLAVPSPLD
ncbi:MAG: hypothetical protein U0836_05055 [Pirellulales bacterium]